MTFLEKYLEDHPNEKDRDLDVDGLPKECPSYHGYESAVDNINTCFTNIIYNDNVRCEKCWNREMPESEEKDKDEPVQAFKTENEFEELIKETNAENEELKLKLEDSHRVNRELEDDFDKLHSAYEELKIKYDELLETHSEAMAKAEIQELKYNPDLVEAVEKAFKNLGMKVVLIKHCNNTSSKEAYLFEVPSDYDVKAGDHVLVNTKKGTATGICLTNSTYVNKDFVEVLAPILGGKCPLKKVIGTYHLEEFDIPEEEENA